MATQAYYTWDALGRPYTIAAWVVYMRGYCARHGIAWLGDLGNDAHLHAPWPEDHAPFSFTGQPLALPLAKPVNGQRYWCCAGDMANAKGLGAAILRDARAGKLPWLKYMNVAGRNYHAADGFKQGAPNADQHVHLSGWTDELLTDITGYDPLGVEDMDAKDQLAVAGWVVKDHPEDDGLKDGKISVGTALTSGYGHARRAADRTAKLLTGQDAILKAVAGTSADQIIAEIKAQGDATRAALNASIATAAQDVTAAVVAAVDVDLDEAAVGQAVAQALAARLAD